MSGTTDAHELYMQGLRNVHAMETQALEIMQRQVDRLENYPEMRAGLQKHIQETEAQQQRVEQILSRHGTSHSSVKDALTGLLGNLTAVGHAMTTDEVIKNSFANYAFENYEKAAYTSLIAMAEAAGDQQAVPLLRQNFEQEEAFAKFCEAQIVPTTLKYMRRSEAGQTAKV
jgi:ferritin-like metal-binding protein YciE